MKCYLKELRKKSYKINKFDDYNLPCSRLILSDQDLIDLTVHFFKTESKLIYPAKSFFVAIVYAYCLNKYFNEDFYKSLNDPDLLLNDPSFVPYSKAKFIYNSILERIDSDIECYKSTEKTIDYFKQEFMIL